MLPDVEEDMASKLRQVKLSQIDTAPATKKKDDDAVPDGGFKI